jgi:hypothetical protein
VQRIAHPESHSKRHGVFHGGSRTGVVDPLFELFDQHRCFDLGFLGTGSNLGFLGGMSLLGAANSNLFSQGFCQSFPVLACFVGDIGFRLS